MSGGATRGGGAGRGLIRYLLGGVMLLTFESTTMPIGVTGTPSMITLDGTMIPGYVPPVQLRQRLEALAGPAE